MPHRAPAWHSTICRDQLNDSSRDKPCSFVASSADDGRCALIRTVDAVVQLDRRVIGADPFALPWPVRPADGTIVAGLAGLSAAGTIRPTTIDGAAFARTSDALMLRLGLRPEDVRPATGDVRAELFASFDRFGDRPPVHARFSGLAGGEAADRSGPVEAALTRGGARYSVAPDALSVRGGASAAGRIIAAVVDRDHPLVAGAVPPALLKVLQQGGLNLLAALSR